MEEAMSKQIILWATFAALVMAGQSHAQIANPNEAPMPPVVEWPPDQTAQMTNYAVVLSTPELPPDATPSTSALMTRVVRWLSAEFGVPANYNHPRIELVSLPKMATVLRRRIGLNPQTDAVPEFNDQRLLQRVRDIAAVYEDATRTIYLPEGWTGGTPAEVSVLVHEMVHHLQNLSGQKYECAAAREKPAYTAQQKWLALSGRNFFEEFDTDPMTLLVRTACGF
jgi:hypothetical protein